MLIDFNAMEEKIIPNMRGGEKEAGMRAYDDGCEPLTVGSCHYCPKGHSHSLINDGDQDLIFFAIVPQHGA